MKCPKCDFKFTLISVAKISRWTSIHCNCCGEVLNRNYGIQAMLVCLVSITPLLGAMMLEPFSTIWFLCAFGVSLAMCLYLDSATVKLRPAKQRIGWRKILGY